MAETITCEILVIGAGVVGLAAAERLSSHFETVVVEAHEKFGQETSSRNSEVIHSGIYYPPLSCKTRWCTTGRQTLYAFCDAHRIPYRQIGKMVVATDIEEDVYLERLFDHCRAVSVPCQWMNEERINLEEPLIQGRRALYFPETGIVDSHALMRTLEALVRQRGTVAYNHRVIDIRQDDNGWMVTIQSGSSDLKVRSNLVINAAGLSAAMLSNGALSTQKYEHRFCRGRYLNLAASYHNAFRHLIYPPPERDGLGVHVTLDLAGYVRLGPDINWCTGSDPATLARYYDCDWEPLKTTFVEAIRRFCPSIKVEELTPGLVGIRPKLFVDGVAYPDFLIENHGGFIHCLGIESPGLTSCLACADEVLRLATN